MTRYGGEAHTAFRRDSHSCLPACELLGCIGAATVPAVRDTDAALAAGIYDGIRFGDIDRAWLEDFLASIPPPGDP